MLTEEERKEHDRAAQKRYRLAHPERRCYWCGRNMKEITQDHIIPLSKGGLHTETNVVAACQSCNSKKHNRVLSLL